MNPKPQILTPAPGPKEILLYVPTGEKRERSLLLAAAQNLVTRAGASATLVEKLGSLEISLRRTIASVTFAVAPAELGELAEMIERVSLYRSGAGLPKARFIVLSGESFPSGNLPVGTRIFPLSQSETAREALELALEAAEGLSPDVTARQEALARQALERSDLEQRESLRALVARM